MLYVRTNKELSVYKFKMFRKQFSRFTFASSYFVKQAYFTWTTEILRNVREEWSEEKKRDMLSGTWFVTYVAK